MCMYVCISMYVCIGALYVCIGALYVCIGALLGPILALEDVNISFFLSFWCVMSFGL